VAFAGVPWGYGVAHFFMGGAFMVAGALVVLPGSLIRTIRLALVVLVLLSLEEVSQVAIDTREFNWLDLGMGQPVHFS
jgi:hypothetical protein